MKRIKFISVFAVLVLLFSTINVSVYADEYDYKELYLLFARTADNNHKNMLTDAISGLMLIDLNRDEIPELFSYRTNTSHFDKEGNLLVVSDEGYDNPAYKDYSHTIDKAFSIIDGIIVGDSPWDKGTYSEVLAMPYLPGESFEDDSEFCAAVMYRNHEDYLVMQDVEHGFSKVWYGEDGFEYSHDGYNEEFSDVFSRVDLPVSSISFYDEEKQHKYTYGEAMEILLDDYEIAKNRSLFDENKVSDWALDEVNEAMKKNLIPYEMVNDNLTEKVTRAEFAAIAVQLLQEITEEELNWHGGHIVDIDGNKYESYIRGAYQLGITKGCGEKNGGVLFEPDFNITREDLVTMLYRLIKMKNIDKMINGEAFGMPMITGSFISLRDRDTASPYAREGIYFLTNHSIVNGVSFTEFAPFDYATKEQAISLSLRIYNIYVDSLEIMKTLE